MSGRTPRANLRSIAFAILACLAGVVAGTAPVAAAPAHQPVIFVHGWNGDSGNWNEMIADFEADGYTGDELYAWDYNTAQSNKTTAREFAQVVDDVLARTGANAVDVVTHSMGGLNTRWYLKFVDGTSQVDDWVSLAGPNHGTTSAYMCYDTSCSEMRPDSDFLTTLNSDDETPGTVDYGTWWSSCDETINPDESTILDGADNTHTACISHLAFLSDDTVSAQVRSFVA